MAENIMKITNLSSSYGNIKALKGIDIEINKGEIGPISQKLYDTLTGIQWGKIKDKFGWTVKVGECCCKNK